MSTCRCAIKEYAKLDTVSTLSKISVVSSSLKYIKILGKIEYLFKSMSHSCISNAYLIDFSPLNTKSRALTCFMQFFRFKLS